MKNTGAPRLKADHTLSIMNTSSRPYLTWLKEGVKKAEGRVNGDACRKMRVGDSLCLYDRQSGEYVIGQITFKHEYKTFKDMLSSEGVSNMLPFLNDSELAEGVQVYNSFPNSTRVNEFGCVAIGFKAYNS